MRLYDRLLHSFSITIRRLPRITQHLCSGSSSSSMALQPGVGLGLLYNTPPSLSIPWSVSPFVYPIFLMSVDTSSNHLIFGRPLRVVAYSFQYNIFSGIAVSWIFSIWPSHRILWHLINLTMFSPLIIITSNSSFRPILHNSFSFTGPHIFHSIFLSNTANALSYSMVSVHDSEP